MADVKEKINLLDVIPFRSENITAEKGSDGTVTIAFPRFKYEWMRRFLLPKGMSADIHVRLEDHGTAVSIWATKPREGTFFSVLASIVA